MGQARPVSYESLGGIWNPAPGSSLALIGNASGQSFGVEQNLDPRRFR